MIKKKKKKKKKTRQKKLLSNDSASDLPLSCNCRCKNEYPVNDMFLPISFKSQCYANTALSRYICNKRQHPLTHSLVEID